MKRALYQFLIALATFIGAEAQIQAAAGFQVGYPDLSTNMFFSQHPNIDYIVVSYKNDKPILVNFHYNEKAVKINGGTYDLTFEGDRYLLTKNYESLKIPQQAKLTMQYFKGLSDPSKGTYKLQTRLYKDSTSHHFSYYISNTEDLYPEPNKNHRARFKGDFSKLQEKFQLVLKTWQVIAVTDSTLLFTGVVGTDGSLQDVQLNSGTPSPFSNKIKAFIEQETLTFSPAVQDMRNVKYQIKFFIKINQDASVTFLMQ